MSRLLMWIKGLRCRRGGHEWVGTPLPEEFFGLYAMSAMTCRRCGTDDPYFRPPTPEAWKAASERAYFDSVEAFRRAIS